MIDKQRQIGDLLRGADREIKNANLDLAMAYIHRIVELEIKNVYAKAYKERILSLLEAQGMTRLQAEQKAASIVPADLPVTKVEEGKPAAPPPPAIPVVKQSAAPAAQAAAAPVPAPARAPQLKPAAAAAVQKLKRSPAAVEAYRSMLLEIWRDGSINPEEQSRIDSMRDTFAITEIEHAKMEKEVRLTSYLIAIKAEWTKGITNFEPLRKKYQVNDAEQISVEPKMFQLIQSLQSKGSVLVLDDEDAFLKIIKEILEEGGYYCFTSSTGEEGLRLLETMTPDIIICDINFSKPHMSGFAFYERFRSIDRFLTTPFIFLSGLDQDVLVRTGKKLGADDYLFKPVDTEMLLATVEGKLRRSRELKRSY